MPRRKFLRSKHFLALAVTFSLFWGGSVALAETNLNAIVCGVDAQSVITIENPKSDTIINRTKVTVEGTVTHSNQIEVYLDDQYDQTLALRPNQTNYQLLVQANIGTHTLRVEAKGVCGGTVAAQSIFTIPEAANDPSDSSSVIGSEQEVITAIDGVVVPPLQVQDTEKFFAEAGLDEFGRSLDSDSNGNTSFVGLITQVAQQYASSIILIASTASVALAMLPIHAGSALTVFGIPRRLLIVVAIIGGVSALFLGV